MPLKRTLCFNCNNTRTFVQQRLIERLFCEKHCVRHWGHKSDADMTPHQGSHPLVRESDLLIANYVPCVECNVGPEEGHLNILRREELGRASWSRLAKEDKGGQRKAIGVEGRVLGKRNMACVSHDDKVSVGWLYSLAQNTGLAIDDVQQHFLTVLVSGPYILKNY